MRLSTVVLLAAAFAAAGCGGGDGAGEDNGETTTAAAAGPGDAQRGKKVFLTSGCGGCHTFTAAGSTRNAGPNLDLVAKKYDAAFIRTSIVDPEAFREKGSQGKIGGTRSYGSMPAYGPQELSPQQLTEQQLRDLVAFIESGGG